MVCTGSVAIRFELFFSVFEFGLFQLHHNVRRGGLLLVENHNVGALFLVSKGNSIFESRSISEIVII